ncbi:MAG: AI-2E family transporter [Desulfobacula sp.]|jgi:predicted PurR-regulated permease PerM
MTKKQRTEQERIQDLLDIPENKIRFHSETERVWKKKPNSFLEKHPLIAGYSFLTFMLVLAWVTNLSIFIISFLFLYLISDFITNDIRRFIPFMPKAILFSILYVAVIILIIVMTYKVIPDIGKKLPAIAGKLQTEIVAHYTLASERWNLKEFIDPEEVRSAVVTATTATIQFLMNRFKSVYIGAIYFIFALVINLLLYHDKRKISQVFDRKPKSMMFFLFNFVELRIRVFYFYFKQVMGGQIIISLINTLVSSVIVFALHMPSPFLLIGLIFFCGLFPVVGNLVSNTILTVIAFVSIGLWAAGVCLILLVVIHKFEYFLNSKIISGIVNLPMVVSLTSLVICEVLLGLIGLMLAIPLLLFLRHEMEHIPGLINGATEKTG